MTRIGLLAQPHVTGLGIQQMEFARHMKPDKVLLTDLTEVHARNSRNAKRVRMTDWFDDYDRMTVKGIPDERACKWLLDDIDLLFVIETPMEWRLFEWAREAKVKSVLQPNWEFLEYVTRPVPKPDLFLAPSLWNMEQIAQFGEVRYLPVPIATDRIKRREITKARNFVHITGHAAYHDRNGTQIVRQSINFVKNPDVRIKVHDQSRKEAENYWDLYGEGDVLLLPRRYGGLSLQLQEATASGMPVVVTERDPYASENCTVTIPGPYTHDKLKLKAPVDSYSAQPRQLAEVIDDLTGKDITDLSEKAYQWALTRSWNAMKPVYEAIFEELVNA